MLFHKTVKLNLMVVMALMGTLLFALPAQADPAQPPTYKLRNIWAPPAIGYIVRGSTTPPGNQAVFPVYQVGGFGCDYTDNTVEVATYFGFTGTVNVEILNLPAGVTSQTASSLTLSAPRQRATTDLALTASSAAALGDFTITIRTTSGSIVQTRDMPIRIVDGLPECFGDNFGGNPLLPDQVTIEEAEYDSGKQELRIEASECCDNSSAMLWAIEASSGQVIGMLEFKGFNGNFGGRFEGELGWPVNPQQLLVISSPSGGWNVTTVTAK